MPRTMKAAVVREFSKPLIIEEVSVPGPGPSFPATKACAMFRRAARTYAM